MRNGFEPIGQIFAIITGITTIEPRLLAVATAAMTVNTSTIQHYIDGA
jgi:hypothetical protein